MRAAAFAVSPQSVKAPGVRGPKPLSVLFRFGGMYGETEWKTLGFLALPPSPPGSPKGERRRRKIR